MKRKGFVSVLEMISAVVILFVAFSIFFPGFVYKNKWNEALILLKSRDIILTLDRTDRLYEYSFDSSKFNYFLNQIFPQQNIIFWLETEGALKSNIVVGCNCSEQQISNLIAWTAAEDIRINDRNIHLDFVESNLDSIYPESDVLLIWGERSLDAYNTQLKEFLDKGNGIVLISNFASPPDSTTKEIFGIDTKSEWGSEIDDLVVKPLDSRNITYEYYKNFYHIPINLIATQSSDVCPKGNVGNFRFRSNDNGFLICPENSSIYFDTSPIDGEYELGPVLQGDSFILNSYNFRLNYIINNQTIAISFKPEYKFNGFCTKGSEKIKPLNDEIGRIFVYSDGEPDRTYCVIVNKTIGKTAWVIDFSDDVGDDHKNLIQSLILSVSSKRILEPISENLKVGYITSYVNVKNQDIFEVYKFNLGLGFPF